MRLSWDAVFKQDNEGFIQPRFGFEMKDKWVSKNIKVRSGASLNGIDFFLFEGLDMKFEKSGLSGVKLVGFYKG